MLASIGKMVNVLLVLVMTRHVGPFPARDSGHGREPQINRSSPAVELVDATRLTF